MNYYDAQRVQETRKALGMSVNQFASHVGLQASEITRFENCSNIGLKQWRAFFSLIASKVELVPELSRTWKNPVHRHNKFVIACGEALDRLDVGYSLMPNGTNLMYIHFYGYDPDSMSDVIDTCERLNSELPRGFRAREVEPQYLAISTSRRD